MKAAVQQPSGASGIELANWTLRQAQEEGGAAYVLESFGIGLSRTGCLNYLRKV